MENKPKAPSVLAEVGSLLLKLLAIGVFFLLIFTFLFGLHIQHGSAMESALKDGDFVLYYRLDKEPDARDLLVYETPEGDVLVGRVVAVPGETVDITSEGLKVNGFLQNETYVTGETLVYSEGSTSPTGTGSSVTYPLTLKTGEYFVLGDSRENSLDSRLYGPVTDDNNKGRVVSVYRRGNF